MVEAARGVRDGNTATPAGPQPIPHVKLRSFEGIVPRATDWRTLGASPEELAPEASEAP